MPASRRTTTIATGSHVSLPLRLLASEAEAEDSSHRVTARVEAPGHDEAPPGGPGGASCSGLRWLQILGRGTGTADQGVIAD